VTRATTGPAAISSPRQREAHVMLGHGGGGQLTDELLQTSILPRIGNEILAELLDAAVVRQGNQRLAVSIDGYVVQPLKFPGGDIGRLAVSGTVNDLAMMGATEPLGLTCGLIVEEGFPLDELKAIRTSMAQTSAEAGAPILSGDTKVMGRGEIDGLVLNTTGVGIAKHVVRDSGLRPGDLVITTGTLGDHGIAVMAARHQLDLGGTLRSDVAPLNSLIREALRAGGAGITAMKDPTRGGTASALHELAEKSGVGILLDERALPVRDGVRAAAELLGLDPLMIANEGKALLGVHPDAAAAVLRALRGHALGRDAAVIGVCSGGLPGSVVLDTGFGRRLLTEPDGELLPRIC
jgi:hydrogenase expression/formation protein HypE